MTTSAPRWDLTNVYPALDSKQFKNAMKQYKTLLDDMEVFLNKASKANAKTEIKRLGNLLGEAIDRLNKIYDLSGTLNPYIYSFVSTDSHNKEAKRIESEFEQIAVKANILNTKFQAWVGKLGKPAIKKAAKTNASAGEHIFALNDAAEQSKYLMSEAEETLAAELTLSG
ncbi:MAG: hypothetical protein ACK40V_08700, partial [Anaerolineales bacterium]